MKNLFSVLNFFQALSMIMAMKQTKHLKIKSDKLNLCKKKRKKREKKTRLNLISQRRPSLTQYSTCSTVQYSRVTVTITVKFQSSNPLQHYIQQMLSLFATAKLSTIVDTC